MQLNEAQGSQGSFKREASLLMQPHLELSPAPLRCGDSPFILSLQKATEKEPGPRTPSESVAGPGSADCHDAHFAERLCFPRPKFETLGVTKPYKILI